MRKIFSLFALALLTMSAWGANTYVKVTSLDQLVAGQKYILVNEGNNRAMGDITGTSTNYGSAVDITIDNGVIDIEGTAVVELTASEGSPDAFGHPTWYFDINDGSRFLIWVSGNSLNTVNLAIGATGSQWLTDLTDDGVILKNKSDNTRILQYNSGAPRFACYTSAQKPAVLYVQGVPEDEGITSLSQANALDDDESFAFNGNAVVTVQKDNYMFVRDESGFGQIRGTVDGEFANGQVLNPGWNATKTSDGGWVWFTDAEGLSASGETNPELAAPIVLTGAVDESMINAYVLIENQKANGGGIFPGLPPRYYTLPDNTRIYKTDVLWAFNADAGGSNYNVYGIICMVDGSLMINPVAFETYVDFIRGDVDADNEVAISDVSALIDYLLSGDATDVNLKAADCDLDKEVAISDVSALIDYLLSGSWE